jgi:hypothetical protein
VAEREEGGDRAFYLNEAGSMLDEPRGKPMIVVAEDTEIGAEGANGPTDNGSFCTDTELEDCWWLSSLA